MEKYFVIAISLLLGACSTSDQQVAQVIKKNPKLVFDAIEENPDQFVEVVNKAVRKAQESQQQKQIAEMKSQQEDQMKNPLKPALSKEALLEGSEGTGITLVEYADFQCPACRMGYSSLQVIKEKYKGKISFYYKNMPLDFHPMAMPAAKYFEALKKQDKTKAQKFHSIVFSNQNKLRDEAYLKEVSKKLGADMKALASDVQSEQIQARIDDDMEEFQRFGFTGTPVLIVNGIALQGAQSPEEIERVIALTQRK